MFSSSPPRPAVLYPSTPQFEGTSILFTLTHKQESYRLLELPPELLQLLESEKPPVLHLRSSAWKQLPSGLYTTAPGQLYVCGREKVWSVRQVSTSNSVKICRPTLAHNEDEVAISAIANCDSVLELLPAMIDLAWYLEHDIKTMSLANFNEHLDRVSRDPGIVFSTAASRRVDPFANFPAPDAEIEKMLEELCVFEMPGTTDLFRPEPDLLLEAWQEIYSNYAESREHLGGVAPPLCQHDFFIFDRLSELRKKAWQSVRSVIFDLLSTNEGTDAVDSDKTLRFVAKLLLDTKRGGTELDTFHEQCQDLLPRGWASRIALEKLQGQLYEVYESGGKRLVRPCTVTAQQGHSTEATKMKPMGGNKRRWHEKLGEQRDGK